MCETIACALLTTAQVVSMDMALINAVEGACRFGANQRGCVIGGSWMRSGGGCAGQPCMALASRVLLPCGLPSWPCMQPDVCWRCQAHAQSMTQSRKHHLLHMPVRPWGVALAGHLLLVPHLKGVSRGLSTQPRPFECGSSLLLIASRPTGCCLDPFPC
jgi:hypothetical protein